MLHTQIQGPVAGNFDRLQELSNLCAGALSAQFAEDDELVREFIDAPVGELSAAIQCKVYGRMLSELALVISEPEDGGEPQRRGYLAKVHSIAIQPGETHSIDTVFATELSLYAERARSATADLAKQREAQRFAELDVNHATRKQREWLSSTSDQSWLWRKGLVLGAFTGALVAVDLLGLHSSVSHALGLDAYPAGLAPMSLTMDVLGVTAIVFTAMLVTVDGNFRVAAGLKLSPRLQMVAAILSTSATAVLTIGVSALRSGASEAGFISPMSVVMLIAVAATAVVVHVCGSHTYKAWKEYHALHSRAAQFEAERADCVRIERDRSASIDRLETAIKAPSGFRAKVENDLAIARAKVEELSREAELRCNRAVARHRALNALDAPDRQDALARTTVLRFRKDE